MKDIISYRDDRLGEAEMRSWLAWRAGCSWHSSMASCQQLAGVKAEKKASSNTSWHSSLACRYLRQRGEEAEDGAADGIN